MEYPKPKTSNIFNPVDYITVEDDDDKNDECCVTTTTTTQPFNDSHLVKKAGDTMQGTLTIPQLQFSQNGGAVQKKAFTDVLHDMITTNETDITNLKDKTDYIMSVSDTYVNQTHKTRYQNPLDNTEGVGYIGANGTGGYITIVTYDNKPIVFHSDSYVSIWSPDVYVGRDSQDCTLYIRGNGNIYMNGKSQNQAYTDDLYNKTLTSAEKASVINFSDHNYILEQRTLIVRDSRVNQLTNQLTGLEFFDKNLSFNRSSSSSYAPFLMGLTGDNTDTFSNNHLSFRVGAEVIADFSQDGDFTILGDIKLVGTGKSIILNGETQEHAFTPEHKNKLEPITVSELDFTFDKNVIIESPHTLTINGETQNYAFTDELRDKVILSHSTYADIENNETDMTISKQLIINSNFETLTLQGDKIIFNDSSQQDTAFTGSHASKLGLIIESFNGRYQLMSTGSGFEKIEINAESMFLKRGGVLYGEIGALTPTNELHINSYNNKDIILNPGTADIQLLNDVHIGNDLYIGGEIQTKAFTDADHLHLTSLILPNSKIHIEFDVQWDVLNLPAGLTLEPRVRYTNSGYYDITSHDDLLLYTEYFSAVQRTWIGGPKKLRIKYTMNFRSRKGKVDYFKSQLVQYDNTINVFKKVSLFNGRDNYGEFDLLEWIFYNDDMIINIEDGDSLKLYTQWKFIPPDETMDINCRFVIEEL
jgi:hypothetical protein